MADGNATVTVAAMVDGNCNGNGQRQRQRAMTMAIVTELVMTMEMATAIAMATATARVPMTKAGLPLHVPAMCSAMAGQHLASTPMDTKESAFTSTAAWG